MKIKSLILCSLSIILCSLLIATPVLASSQDSVVSNSVSKETRMGNHKSKEAIIESLKQLLEYEISNPQEDSEIDGHMSLFAEIKSLSSNREANDIAESSMIIALIGLIVSGLSVVFTLGIFFYQNRINSKINNDTTKERFENNLFEFSRRLNALVDGIEVLNIAKGRKSFNFIFYEYEMLYNILKEKKLHRKDSEEIPLTGDELSSIAISFVINGVTPNINAGKKDFIYSKYRDLLDKDVYLDIVKTVDYYENIGDEELKKLCDKRKYTLINNYATVKLTDGKRVPWFWGIRYYYMPYIKQIETIFNYLANNKNTIKDIDTYHSYINAMFNDSELGLLYAFVNSKENITSLTVDNIRILTNKSQLAGIYDYKTWG